MRKSFSVIDKQFLRRIVWLLILALFSVLIFWQQTRAEAVDIVAFGKVRGALAAEAGIEPEERLFPLPSRTGFIRPTFHSSLLRVTCSES
jgi:hypothetical protein